MKNGCKANEFSGFFTRVKHRKQIVCVRLPKV